MPASTAVAGAGERAGAGADDRARLLAQALRLALLDDHKELSAAQIAQEADVPIDVFFELFAGKDECYLAALEMLEGSCWDFSAARGAQGEAWPQGVRRSDRAADGLPGRASPLRSDDRRRSLRRRSAGGERNLEIGYGLAALLIEGAPEPAHGGLALEGVVGAIAHTIRCQVASRQVALLPAVSDHLAYVVLAPFIGADAAAEIVIEDPRGAGPASAVAEQSVQLGLHPGAAA